MQSAVVKEVIKHGNENQMQANARQQKARAKNG